MKKILEILRRLRFYLRRDRFDRELEAELRFHLEMKTRDNTAGGMTTNEAAWAARRRLGNSALIQERSRDMWSFRWIETLVQDLRYSGRVMKRTPVLVAAVVLSLGLAIGANTAIFSVIDEVFLKLLPVRNPKQLVLFSWACKGPTPVHLLSGGVSKDEAGRLTSTSFSFLDFARMRASNQTLSDLFAFVPLYQMNVSSEGKADVASGQMVSGNYFRGLGVQAVAGRTLTDDDDRAGMNVAVLSYGFWRERFGLDPGVIGKSVHINGVLFTVVGVTPPGFYGGLEPGHSPDITIPLSAEPQINWSKPAAEKTWYWWVRVMGRLKPGVSIEQARLNLEGEFQRSALQGNEDYIAKNPGRARGGAVETPSLVAKPGGQGLQYSANEMEKPLLILMIVVTLVLLIACANTANLLLARAASRRQEISIRMAIGAGRLRLVRQLLTESIVIALAGGALGLLLAYWGKDLMVAFIQSGAPIRLTPVLDLRVLAFTGAVSLLAGLLFGLVPALRATRVDSTPELKENPANQTSGRFGFTLGRGLIVLQVSVSLLLLVGAGLFLRTLRNLERVNYGFNASNLLLFNVNPTLNGYKGQRIANLYDQLAQKIDSIPGVSTTTISEVPLLSGNIDMTSDLQVPDSKTHVAADMWIHENKVGTNFFDGMGIPLLLGRGFNSGDVARAPKVAVVNQAFARLYFRDESPVGKQFKFDASDKEYTEIVGVVRNTKYETLRNEDPPILYLPYLQDVENLGGMFFEVRTAGDPNAIIPAVRQALQEVDAGLALSEVRTQMEQIDASLNQEKLFSDFTVAFGALALVLSCLGLYGVMSYSLSRRTREIGIRIALGADSRRVLKQTMREAILTVLIGVILGASASLVATKFVKSILFGLSRNDPASIVVASAVLLGVAAIAAFLPARRASKIEPMRALRYE